MVMYSIGKFQAACKTNPDDQEALRAIDLLYDAALVSSGFTVSYWLMLLLYNDLGSTVKLDPMMYRHSQHYILD
jgi:hypothetical protein